MPHGIFNGIHNIFNHLIFNTHPPGAGGEKRKRKRKIKHPPNVVIRSYNIPLTVKLKQTNKSKIKISIPVKRIIREIRKVIANLFLTESSNIPVKATLQEYSKLEYPFLIPLQEYKKRDCDVTGSLKHSTVREVTFNGKRSKKELITSILRLMESEM